MLYSLHTKYYPAVFFVLFIVCSVNPVAQSFGQPVDSVNAVFTKFIHKDTGQNIVLLTSRNIYLAVEKIWFKAYVVAAHKKSPNLMPKNLFADLVSDKDSVIEQLVLDNASQHTDGAFSVPPSIPSGFYWIRCYTARELENNNNGIFLHPVYILNKQSHDENIYARQFENKLTSDERLKPFIHFYAERLTAVPGIISTGVIEIRDGYNNPLSVAGELVNSKDSLIASFKTNGFGLARLTFVNDPSEKYTAIFHMDKHTAKYDFPAANRTSMQLSVSNKNAKTIKAFVTLEDAVPADAHTTILAVQQDKLYYAAVGTGTYGITMPADNFPGGIVRLLLFDAEKNLVNERKVYIKKENNALQVQPHKRKYSERENVNVHIKVTGSFGEPMASILNASVEDEWLQQFSDSIEASSFPPYGDFSLENWLTRYGAKYSTDDIDLLLTTRSSIFKQPFNIPPNNTIEAYDDSKKLQNLTGKIINTKGDGMSDRIVTAMARNTADFYTDLDTTDKEGAFTLSIPQGFDSLQLSLQVTDKQYVPITVDSITVDSFHFPGFPTPAFYKQQFLANNINTLALLKKYHVDTAIIFQGKGWLAPVTVKTIKREVPNYDVSKRINPMSQIVTSNKFRYGGLNAIGNAILMVPGITLSYGDISIFGPDMDFSGNIGRPLVIMDGVPLNAGGGGTLELLNSLSPADIDFIEVLRGAEAAIFGVRGAYGVISVNTRYGADKTDYSQSGFRVFTPVTYHVCPKFEMPDYSNPEIKNSSIPDARTTIYWNGNITTDANGEASFNFFTADLTTNYTVTISGLTENGNLVYKRVTIASEAKNR